MTELLIELHNNLHYIKGLASVQTATAIIILGSFIAAMNLSSGKLQSRRK